MHFRGRAINEETLFLEASALNPEERAAFLDRVCAGRPLLRAAVETLLEAHAEPGDVFSSTISTQDEHVEATLEDSEELSNRGPSAVRPSLERGAVIAGRYTIGEKIAEGGMGEVWVAVQTEPVKRKVALKLIKTGMDSWAVLQRFEQERQALAMMDHPNIARVFDGGMTPAGQPFFVMELVDGMPLSKFCDGAKLTTRERLELFVLICQAVQHAHQKSIIHRDLKPANILVTIVDGKPVPKVIDFGVAKATAGVLDEESRATQFGVVVGTLEYMSPEQAGGSLLDVDTRADVYSLGVLLYEMLTGSLPISTDQFKNKSMAERIRVVMDADPPRPSTRLSTDASLATQAAARRIEPKKLKAMLRGDLDWVVMKCLEKSRERRYETASGLARDIQRFLAGDPVEAGPASVSYRVRKFASKHRAGLATAVGFAALLAAATAVSTWQAVRARAAEHAAVRLSFRESQARKEVERVNMRLREAQRVLILRDYAGRMNLAQVAYESNDVGRTRHLLDQARPKSGEADLRGFEWDYWQRRCHEEWLILEEHRSAVQRVAYSPDGKRLASADWSGRILIRDGRTGKTELDLKAHDDRVNGLAFSADGLRIASSSSDKTIKVWDAVTGRRLVEFKAHSGGVLALAFSPDGRRLASGSATHSVKLWDAADGRLIHQQTGAHGREVTGLAFSPDGRALASAGRDGLVKLWDGESLEPVLTFEGRTGFFQGVAFSPDGRTLATAGPDREARLWDVATGRSTQTLRGHDGAIYGVAFSPDGRTVATASADQTVCIWDASNGRRIRRFLGHTDLVSSVAFHPDGRFIASCGFDQKVRIWKPEGPPEPLTIDAIPGAVASLAFSPDGRLIAFGGAPRVIELRDPATGEFKAVLRGPTEEITSLAFSPDGRRVASVSLDQSLWIWDVATMQPVLTLERLGEGLQSLAFSPDGRRLAADHLGATVNVRDATTGRVSTTLVGLTGDARVFIFSPDGRRLAVGGSDGVVRTWDLETGEVDLTLEGRAGAIESVAFSPDGRWLASSSMDLTIKIHDATTGREVQKLTGHSGRVRGVAFTPDSRRLASASDDRTVKLFDVASGEELLTLKGHGGWVYCLAFSPDGRRVATGGFDRTVKIWNASPIDFR